MAGQTPILNQCCLLATRKTFIDSIDPTRTFAGCPRFRWHGMVSLPLSIGLAAVALTVTVTCEVPAARAEDLPPCTEDAMLVFDASGSMSGNGWGYGSENPTAVSRIDKVRSALAKVLPSVTRFRRVGTHHIWPGPLQPVQRPPQSQANEKCRGPDHARS